TLLPRTEGMWIVPAERIVDEAFTIRVVPLTYAWAGEVASTLSWVAPPSVRIVPYYPTNSLVISGHPAAVESLIDLIRWRRVGHGDFFWGPEARPRRVCFRR